MSRHSWESDLCAACGMRRVKPAQQGGATKYYAKDSDKAIWIPGECSGKLRDGFDQRAMEVSSPEALSALSRIATSDPTGSRRKARLDTAGTAKGKTILTGPVEGKNGPTHWAGPATAHIDTETGKRTALRVTNRVEQTPEPTKQPELPAETMGKIIMPGHALDGMKASLVLHLPDGGFDVRVREKRGVFEIGCVVECRVGEWEPS